MDRIRIILALLLLGAACSLIGGSIVPGLGQVIAQAPPPPPPTISPAPTLTDTGVPPPTDTNTPQPQPTATTGQTAVPPPVRTSAPNPDCQSAVSGYVRDQAGNGVAGATVSISGEGWANAMLTNDDGLYGFASLCAGVVTLQATLPDGRMTVNTTVELDGANVVMLDLGVSSWEATAAPQGTTPAETPTPEPEMPQTGYSGWLLAGGGALLGALVLLLAGVRRKLKQQL